ncbi:MAG: NifU family protein [Planctomycetota bacterium]|nr:NifU family protein [Planctomycetota bacterium]
MSEQAAPVEIRVEATPNPNSHRFAINRRLFEGPGRDFAHPGAALDAPLAQELFRMPGVRGVFVGPEFVTVTMQEGTSWGNVRGLIKDLLEEFVKSGRAPFDPDAAPPPRQGHAAAPGSNLEQQIVEVLDREIRPAVAMDGGDIVFAGFEKGVVKLQLKGSCHGCPSSLMTLRMGIENRLKMQFPEVESVQAVS